MPPSQRVFKSPDKMGLIIIIAHDNNSYNIHNNSQYPYKHQQPITKIIIIMITLTTAMIMVLKLMATTTILLLLLL